MEHDTPKCPVCGSYLEVDDVIDRDHDDPNIIEEAFAYCPECMGKDWNSPWYVIRRVFTCSKTEILRKADD